MRALRWIAIGFYKIALAGPNTWVIFQNDADRARLLATGAVAAERAVMIRGSGVDLASFKALPEPAGAPVVCMAARLLAEKGVHDYVEAARIVRRDHPDVRFVLAGVPDPGNPSSVTDTDIERWRSEGVVELVGHRDDIQDLFASSHVVVLPTYYGEGLPKVLIEAAAAGRAIVTTDHPGSRDAIVPGETGLLVPPRDPAALARAIVSLTSAPGRRAEMGRRGRAFAETRFALADVVAAHLSLYRSALAVCVA
jgi:glycosyltransferase involved in cell wall biosynthesis